MKHSVNRRPPGRRQFLALAAIAAATAPAWGQSGPYPNRPVKIVVPYPPGGTNDVVARLLAHKLQEAWGQPVVVDNRAGAAGNIGSAEVARAAPDGYTLLLTGINIVSMNPALIDPMPFDPQKAFAPISLLGTTSLALAVHSGVPVNSVQELIELARRQPGKLSYASSGTGSPQQLLGEMFRSVSKLDLLHVPYKGAAPAVNDLVGGQVHMTMGIVNQLIPHVRAGKLKALAVTGRKRQSSLPDVPTFEELGIAGFDSEMWLALAAPVGTPPALVETLNQAVRKAMPQPDVVARLAAQGVDVLVSSPEQMRQRGVEDLRRWSEVIRTAGIKIN